MGLGKVSLRAAPSTGQRLAGLDGLRFFAAFIALAYHYLFRGHREGGYLTVGFETIGSYFQYAYFGVPIFFMISGFVILWSSENKNWIEFTTGRVIRLWPAYIAALTFTACVMAWHDTSPFQTNFAHWLANLTFFAPAFGFSFMDGVYWTIVLEIIFYFWVAVGVATGVLRRFLLPICLGWIGLMIANELWFDSGLLRLAFLTRYGAWFLVGVMSYQIWSKGRDALSVAILVLAAALASLCAMLEHIELAQIYRYHVDFTSILFVALASQIIFFFTVSNGHKIQSNTVLLALGGMTYPLYLIHQNAGYIMIERLTVTIGPWGALLYTCTFMLLMAYGIYRWWERPIGKIMRRGFSPLTKIQAGY